MKKFLPIVLVVLSTLATFLFTEILFRALILNNKIKFKLADQPGRVTGLYQYDKDLGWKNRPNYKDEFEWPYGKTKEFINSQGWRDFEYTDTKPAGVYRIAIIGCSRTYGLGVNMEETYSKDLEQLLNQGSTKRYEVLNFGVNGYGLDQIALNYSKNVRRYSPDLVILQVYMPSVSRSSQKKMWATLKPAFILQNNQLTLINSPVPENKFFPLEQWFMRHSCLYRFVKDKFLKIEESERLKNEEKLAKDISLHQICASILAQLNDQVTNDHSRLIVFTWGESNQLQEILMNAKVKYFVLEDYSDFKSWVSKGELENPPPVSHWSVLGHQFVAESIYNYIQKNMLKGEDN